MKGVTMAKDNNDIIGQLLQEVFTDRDGLKRMLELLVNNAMRAELAEHVKADAYQRSSGRLGHRNGFKPRTLATRIGKLDLRVPQSRNCEAYRPTMFNRWQRSERALLIACAEMYFQGVSTRRVQDVLEQMCGMDISAATVSRIASELDEKLVVFRRRRLDNTEYQFLHIDARYEKVRVQGHIISQAVLVVVGIDSFGFRRILDWRIADSESLQSWGQLFKDLKDRGLTGLKMVTSDAHKGIRAAIDRYFQGVIWQRCRVHLKRELLRKIAWRYYHELLGDIAAVFMPEDRVECLRRSREMADKWRDRYPAVAKLLEEGIEDCLAVCSLPVELRKKMSSTNMMENIMKQLKARSRVVGIFPNRDSCDRLMGALLLEIDEQWQAEDKPYLRVLMT
jgi:transposase-like protein